MLSPLCERFGKVKIEKVPGVLTQRPQNSDDLNNYPKRYLTTFTGRRPGSVPSDGKCLICNGTFIKSEINVHYMSHYHTSVFNNVGISPSLNLYYRKVKGSDKLCFYIESTLADVTILKIQYCFNVGGLFAEFDKPKLFDVQKHPMCLRSSASDQVFFLNYEQKNTEGTIYMVLHQKGKQDTCFVESYKFKIFFEGTIGKTKYLKATQLTASNTETYFKTLLEFEDVEVLKPYKGLSIEHTWLIFKSAGADNMDEYRVELPGLFKEAKKFANTIKPDDEAIFSTDSLYYYGIVLKVDKENIAIEMPQALGRSNIKGSIIFQPGRLSIRYQYRALELLAMDLDVKNFLFPTNIYTLKDSSNITLDLINPEIGDNQEQLQAVKNIVADSEPISPYIIFGPPGTGKTTTLVEIILQLRLREPQNRILVTAGSNSACNTIAIRLCEHFNKTPRADKCFELLRIFSKSISKQISSVDPVLLDYSNCCKKHNFPDVSEISSYGIIVTTLCTVGKLVSEGCTFTHAFIDEAGATSEPETLLGIMGNVPQRGRRLRVILSGDHKQLGPVLMSKEAAFLGLQVSMMERLLQLNCYKPKADGSYDPTIQTRLRRNYRSHPAIVQLYNHLFYNNELLAAGKGAHIDKFSSLPIVPNNNFPIIFVPVNGKVLQKPPSKSSYNQEEIDEVLKSLKLLLNSDVPQKDIGVITPYNLQSFLIKEQFVNFGWKDIEIGSVEKFQGQEKPIIIASFVRSFSGLGFIGEPRRLNVLLSRAKSLLILIGNPKTLSQNENFKYIITKCEDKNRMLRPREKECNVTDLNDELDALHL